MKSTLTKKFKIIFSLSLVLLLFPFYTKAQKNVEFEKDNFPGREKEFKEARKNYNNGKDLFDKAFSEYKAYAENFINDYTYLPPSRKDYMHIDDEIFESALPFFELAYKFNPDHAALNWMIGFIHFQHSHLDDKCTPYLEKAFAINPKVEKELPYNLAWAHHIHLRWDDAIKYYEIYKNNLDKDDKLYYEQRLEDVNKKIFECNNGKKYSQNPQRVFVDNMGGKINSHYPDYSAYISADESVLMFTSRRETSMGAEKDNADHAFFEDIFTSVKTNGEWSEAENIGTPINSVDHDATAGLSPDGTTLYIYAHHGKGGGDIYRSKLNGKEWTKPEKLGKTINSESRETTISEWYDGSKLLFISNKPGGKGAGDIYLVNKDEKGNYTSAINVGEPLNTKYGEEGVFLVPDGKTLYFSSRGHATMGGYDVFKTTYENGKWSEPENLGYPVNGPDDDVYFVMSGSGRRGYYASAKEGGFGEKDLYMITFLGPEKPFEISNEDNLLAGVTEPVKSVHAAGTVEIASNPLTILKGTITDAKTKKPLEASIELVDNSKNQVIATFKSNSVTGKYTVMLPSGKNYGIVVKATDYLFHSENVDIPLSTGYQEIIKDIELQSISVGSKIVLRNIFFDFDKDSLRPESTNELERLAKLLNDIPSLKIEISSHTDSKGSDEYNQRLSQLRSVRVVNYLINEKKIAQDRLVAKGYGETKPIATNDTDEGRQQNRRSEFEILSK